MPEFEFSEKDQKLVEIMMERFDETEHGILVRGNVRSIHVRPELTRQYGGQYTSDKMGNTVIVDTDLPCDAFVEIPDQEVLDSRSSIPVAAAYLRRLNQEFMQQGYQALVHHGDQVFERRKLNEELKNNKPKEETF